MHHSGDRVVIRGSPRSAPPRCRRASDWPMPRDVTRGFLRPSAPVSSAGPARWRPAWILAGLARRGAGRARLTGGKGAAQAEPRGSGYGEVELKTAIGGRRAAECRGALGRGSQCKEGRVNRGGVEGEWEWAFLSDFSTRTLILNFGSLPPRCRFPRGFSPGELGSRCLLPHHKRGS